MKDNLPHFSHDNDASTNKRMKALRAHFGWEGYGRFWAFNEAVARATRARLDLSTKLARADLANDLGLTIPEFEAFLAFLADPEECGLIHLDNGVVTTDRTQEDLSRVMENRLRKRKDGKHPNHAENDISTPEQGNGAPDSQKGAPKHRREEKRRVEEHKASSGFEAEFAEFAADRKIAAADTAVENSDLILPGNLRFSAEDLEALAVEVGGNAQAHLDTYARLMAKHGYRYKNHWAGLRDFWAKAGGAALWLAKANGNSSHEPESAKPFPSRAETVLTPEEEAEVAALSAVFEQSKFIHRDAATG